MLSQTFRDFEFIAIDDGSNDRTPEILRKYAVRDSRLIVLHGKPIGLTKALNQAAKLARGRYIARMDADDVSEQNRLQRQVEYLETHPDCLLLGGRVLLVDADGLPLRQRPHDCEHDALLGRLIKGDGGALTHPAVMFRRDAFEAIGGYDEAFATAQDLDLFIRFAARGRIHNLDEMLLRWRQHEGSVNRTRSDTWNAMKTLALSKALAALGAERFIEIIVASSSSVRQEDWTFHCIDMALQGGSHRSAWQLARKAFHQGPNRRRAANLMLKTVVQVLRKACFNAIDKIICAA